jgi:uncharacterized protein (DUF2267 family)
MTTGLEGIEHSIQLTHSWINEVDAALGWSDKHRSFRLLRAVLQALRDWLPANEAVDLAAQLPTLLRGVYYEHWRPSETPVKARNKADFLARIDHEFRTDPIIGTEDAIKIVFELLNKKISDGEIKDVRQSLPAALRHLWP